MAILVDHVGTVQQMIAENFGVGIDQVTPATQLVGDLYADSLDLVELVMDMEAQFAIEISDEDAEKCKTVQDVVDLVNRLANQQ